jgi:hypothetical protein
MKLYMSARNTLGGKMISLFIFLKTQICGSDKDGGAFPQPKESTCGLKRALQAAGRLICAVSSRKLFLITWADFSASCRVSDVNMSSPLK